MNHKGQTLVLFVILLPIFLVFLTLLIEFSTLSLEKKRWSASIRECLEYGMKHIEEENIDNHIKICIDKNINNHTSQISIQEKSIEIIVDIKLQNFRKLFRNNENVRIIYKGFIENEKIRIVRG